MGEIIHQFFSHDDGCQTLFTRNMKDCKCNVEIKRVVSPNMKFTEEAIKRDIEGFIKTRKKYN